MKGMAKRKSMQKSEKMDDKDMKKEKKKSKEKPIAKHHIKMPNEKGMSHVSEKKIESHSKRLKGKTYS